MAEHQLVPERMQTLIAQWEAAADQRAIFLKCYMLMTRNVLAAIEAGEFQDAAWVTVLLERFADYYFDALDAYEQQRLEATDVWRFTHETALAAECMAIQNLLLGINAHINYDLVLTLVDILESEWASLSDETRQRRYLDHCLVNDVIRRTIDTVQDMVIEPVEPAMDLVDKLLGPVDEWVASQMITRWRDEVWEQVVLFMETAQPHEREQLRRQLAAAALQRANVILLRP